MCCRLTGEAEMVHTYQHCNDLGIDTIETGATIAVLMDVGLADFGNVAFMEQVFEDLKNGTENGRLWAQGTARVGEHYGLHRVPVIKKQAISAYDPRVIEVTGISMMTTAQGADHTAGNVPRMESFDKELPELMEASLASQIASAAVDSLGICLFGRSVTNPNVDFLANAVNDAVGTNLDPNFFQLLGRETLQLEREFNLAAGFTEADDELPAFFYNEPLAPTNRPARFHGSEVHDIYERMDDVGTEGVPDKYGRVH